MNELPINRFLSTLATAAASLLIATTLRGVAADDQNITTLSDNDAGYKILGQIQENICQGHPTHPCSISSSYCSDLMESLSTKLFPGDNQADKESLTNVIKASCAVRGTPFELPGIHWLLETRFKTADRIAEELGIKLPEKIVYGALPAAGANAEVQIDPQAGPPIILVNVAFLEFVNEFSKLAAQTIPYEIVHNQYGFDAVQQASVTKINSSPELRRRFIDLIDYFYLGVKHGELVPNEISKTVQAVYTAGIETFSVAHEIGHIYYNHPSSTLDINSVNEEVRKLLGLDHSGVKTSLREIEADGFALPIVMRMRDDAISDGKNNPFFVSVLHAAEFYFIAQEIVEEASRLSRDGAAATEGAQWSPAMRSDVPKVVACDLKAGCRARDLKDLNPLLRDGTGHPPHQFRAEVIREAINTNPPAKYGEWAAIADLTNRNARLLWEATKGEYLASHAKP